MTGRLVETKLFLPTARRDVIARPRLHERLVRHGGDEGGGLVLISAPAGFGKTTLLAAWLQAQAAEDHPVSWVSLDEGDRDGYTFWSYLLTAIDRAMPGVGVGALSLLQTRRGSVEDVLAGVVNELSVLPGELTLVLDDYHLADGAGIRLGMAFLVDHLPPQLRLVISTRADPAISLARLRARGKLVEIRAADLRFTPLEAAAYLNTSAGLQLAADQVATLDERTEGWIAALQLAALSLRDRADASRFIAAFAGDDRYIVDYLVEEVLDRQPEPVRRFLVETSILERLTGDLCDAVTGVPGGRAMLERLDRDNLFLIPLDTQRHWYRYHHLFADLLRSRLLDEHEDVSELHRRASRWHDQAGDPVGAVRHALAAGDYDRAADLVELAVPDLRRTRQEATLRRWIGELPDAVVDRRPVLAMGFVGALMSSNDFDDVERRLVAIEHSLTRADTRSIGEINRDGAAMVVVDEFELTRLPGGIELYRAALALVAGDTVGTLNHARRAVDLAPDDDDLTRASAAALIGLASLATGDLRAAHRGYTDAADGLRRLGYLSDVLGCAITLADIETAWGRLRQAQRTYQQGLDLALAADPAMRGVADMHTGLAGIAVERGEMAVAADHLRRAEELGEAAGLPQNPWRWRVTMALLRDAEGDGDAALALLTDAERVYVADFQPMVRPISAMRARIQAARRDLTAALDWGNEHGVRAGDDLSYLREYEHLTLGRVLIAQHAAGGARTALIDALTLLQRLLIAAEDGGRTGSVIDCLIWLAVGHRANGNDPNAFEALERALVLAEPEGYVQVFTDGREPVAALLTTIVRRRPGWAYPRQLLDAVRPARDRAVASGPSGRPSPGRLVEPFTDRERDVLRLLAGELDGPSIARELVLSLNTVRTHTKNIYAKLGVTSRRAAVARAHQLNLLSRTGHR